MLIHKSIIFQTKSKRKDGWTVVLRKKGSSLQLRVSAFVTTHNWLTEYWHVLAKLNYQSEGQINKALLKTLGINSNCLADTRNKFLVSFMIELTIMVFVCPCKSFVARGYRPKWRKFTIFNIIVVIYYILLHSWILIHHDAFTFIIIPISYLCLSCY